MVSRILAESGNRFVPAILGTLRTHPSVWGYLRQLGGKLAWTWHWYEIPNNENFYYYRLHSAVLRYLPVTFFILAPLGILGLLVAAPRFVSCGTLYCLVLTSFIPLITFYVLSRFRAPLMAALIPFAALSLWRTCEWIIHREWRKAAEMLK